MNQVVRWLCDYPFLDSWDARYALMNAKSEERRLRLYEMDLLWLNVKRGYQNLPQPSEVANESRVRDNRSGKQIMNDMLKKLQSGVKVDGTV